MIQLSDGGYLNYGTAWRDTVEFGLRESDMVLIKTDSCGKLVWINDEGYLADGDPDMNAIEIDSGNILIVGYTAAGLPGSMGNIRVGKYDYNGKLLKETRIPGSPISAPNNVIRNVYKTNSYLINGSTYNVQTELSKPLLVEIDNNLNIVKWKEISDTSFTKVYNKSSSLHKIIQKNNLINYAIITAGASSFDTIYLAEIDTAFNVIHSQKLINDTIKIYYGYNVFFLDKEKENFIGYVEFSTINNTSYKKALVKMDTKGNIHTVGYLPETGIGTITCMNPTQDGGYILGPRFIKVDSNLNIEWIKPMHGQLNSVVQLPDGGYVGGGLSDARTQSWGEGFFEMYLVRTDKDGKYIRSGITEADKSNDSQVLTYPNPVSTILHIQSSYPHKAFELWNTTGNLAYKGNAETQTIDVSNIAEGLYMLRILGENEQWIVKKISILR